MQNREDLNVFPRLIAVQKLLNKPDPQFFTTQLNVEQQGYYHK